MKSKAVRVIVSCIVIAAIGFGGFYGYNTYFVKKTVAATPQYYTVTARTMNLQETVQGTGAAYAAITKDVSPNNNGTLKDLTAKVGDTVTAGQKLFVSDSDDLRKNVTNAKNNLTRQNLTLSSDENAQRVDDNKIVMDKLSVSDAQAQLNDANQQLNKMTVTASIGGVVTAVNNINNDSVQPGSAVLTIVDMSSIKVKVSVDELDIGKIQTGQTAQISFDAIQGKTFEGSVESIAQTGTTSNNVTTYDVVVSIKDPAGIRLGMNANVTITVQSKDNALVIPAEALVENNGQKFVRVESADSTASQGNNQTSQANTQGQAGNGQNSNQTGSNRNNRAQVTSNSGRLVAIKTGLETENYIEVTEGLTEGQRVLVELPQASSTTNNNNRNSFGGAMGGFGGAMGGARSIGGNNGGTRPQGGNNNGNISGNSGNSSGAGAQGGNSGGARN